MSKSRLSELDALRGIAALAVVIYHLVYRYHEIYGHSEVPVYWASFGHYGVHLFFMISGFVIYWTLDRNSAPREFVISRFARLYPVYWAAATITFVLSYWFDLSGRQVDIMTFFANLTMLHEYAGFAHVDGVYWTLTLEMTFYLWVLLLLTVRLQRFASVLLVFLVIANAALSWFDIDQPTLHLLTLNGYGHLFLLGVAVYDYQQNRAKGRALLSGILALVVMFSSMTTLGLLILLSLFGAFYLAVSGRLQWLTQPVLLWFGAISYSLYLIHQNVGYMLINFAADYVHSSLAIVFSFCVVIVLAYGLNRLIEVPCNKRLRDYLKARFVSRHSH